MNECQACQDWKKCAYGGMKEYFTYGEVRWCPYQIIFIIQSLDFLPESWPPNPDGSSYVDPNVQTSFRAEAYYTKPSEVLAELEVRMGELSRDAQETLIDEIQAGLSINHLSRLAYDALMFVKGFRRKKNFPRWRAGKRYKEKIKV